MANLREYLPGEAALKKEMLMNVCRTVIVKE